MNKIYSFGYKHGLPALVYEKHLLMIDVRKLIAKNPYWVPELRPLRGDHPKVGEFIRNSANFESTYSKILKDSREWDGHVIVGCTGGHHRSVYVAHRLGIDLGREVIHLHYDTGPD